MRRSSSGWALGAGASLIASLAIVTIGAQPPALDPILGRAGAYCRRVPAPALRRRRRRTVRAGRPLSADQRHAHESVPHHPSRAEVGSADGQTGRRRPLAAVPRRLRRGRQAGARSQRTADAVVPRSRPVPRRRRPSASSTKSARYNIGNLLRTINTPVFALLVLDPANQRRFTFKITERADPLLEHGGTKPAGVVVEFQEIQKETMIRTTNDRDMPARGRFWIEAGDRTRAPQRADRRGPVDSGDHRRRLRARAVEPPVGTRNHARALRHLARSARASTAKRPTRGSGSFRSRSTRNSRRW